MKKQRCSICRDFIKGAKYKLNLQADAVVDIGCLLRLFHLAKIGEIRGDSIKEVKKK